MNPIDEMIKDADAIANAEDFANKHTGDVALATLVDIEKMRNNFQDNYGCEAGGETYTGVVEDYKKSSAK